MPVAIPIIAVAVGAVASAAVGGGIIGALVGAGTAFAITSVGGSVFPSRPPSSPAIPSRAVDNTTAPGAGRTQSVRQPLTEHQIVFGRCKVGGPIVFTIVWFQRAFALNNWQNTLATDAELERIIAMVDQGLKEGGIGIGINGGYAPGYGRKEYHALAQLAVRHDVPTYTHFRYASVKEPQSAFEAMSELISLSATTGAHMHVCHLNSTGGRDVEACADLIRGAQARGLKVTVEAYPYGAGSSVVGAELFRGADWLDRWGLSDPGRLTMNGTPLTQAQIDELQRSNPGAIVVIHFLRPDEDPRDEALMDVSVMFPNAAIASDAMPWTNPAGAVIEGDVWPLPDDAFAHPRSAGCYSRFIGRWVRERNKLSLLEAIRKTSLIPAQILEHSVAQMRTKGRLQVGADADIVVFDLATIRDRATFIAPVQLAEGMRHVLVNGTPVIRDGALIRDAKPGRPVRRPVTG